MTFIQFNQLFPTQEKATEYFIQLRWGGTLTCPHCGATKGVYHLSSRYVICTDCSNSYSVFHGTIFHHSKLDIRQWLYAINIFLNDKKGVSACNLMREIGVTYRTAWRMLQQIRAAMGNPINTSLFSGIVEVDESYFGHRTRQAHHSSTQTPIRVKRGRGTSKTPVVGVLERNSQRVQAHVMLPDSEGKTLSGKQLLEFIENSITPETQVITDTFPGYRGVSKKYPHETVNHSIGEYSRGNGVHINTIEGFWSIGKRSVIGVYHQVSRKYLQRYIDEWSYRANHRNNPAMFDQLLKQSVIKEANRAWVVD